MRDLSFQGLSKQPHLANHEVAQEKLSVPLYSLKKEPFPTRHKNIKEELALMEAISRARAAILDTFELELGEASNWRTLRARVLRIFGERGLEGQIRAITSASSSEKRGAL